MAALAGVWESARRVELVLPELGSAASPRALTLISRRSAVAVARPTATQRRWPDHRSRRTRAQRPSRCGRAGVADASLAHRRCAVRHRDGLVGILYHAFAVFLGADAAQPRLLRGRGHRRLLARGARFGRCGESASAATWIATARGRTVPVWRWALGVSAISTIIDTNKGASPELRHVGLHVEGAVATRPRCWPRDRSCHWTMP